MVSGIKYEPMDEATWWEAEVVFLEVGRRSARVAAAAGGFHPGVPEDALEHVSGVHGCRADSANSGETRFRVSGNRRVDIDPGETSFRVLGLGRMEGADAEEKQFRVRADGHVFDVETGATVYRLTG